MLGRARIAAAAVGLALLAIARCRRDLHRDYYEWLGGFALAAGVLFVLCTVVARTARR